MPRKRRYTDIDVTAAATQVFWDRGYQGTAIDDLQDATGLSRSSLYLAFGTKRSVFDAALAEYVASVIDPRIRPLEAPQANLREAAAFFRGLARWLGRPDADRGCLVVNAIAELAGRDPSFAPVGAEYIDRYRRAFSNALGNAAAGGAMNPKLVPARSTMLTMSVLGVFLVVRSNAAVAAANCRAIAKEISSWDAVGARA